MFHNILVAVDGTPHSDLALAQAIDLAESERTRLTLLTAVVPPPVSATAATAGLIPAAIEAAKSQAIATLGRARDRIPADLPVTTVLTEDPIRKAMIRRIKEGQHDLVVMGSRGRGAIRSALFGSVSHYVLHHCQVPVLIVHADKPDRTPHGERGLTRPRLVRGVA
jgi:nucleotide-binding universal stress UspA family protein